jgi:hypothetical protein
MRGSHRKKRDRGNIRIAIALMLWATMLIVGTVWLYYSW